MIGKVVLESVRQYRTIASLYRQTAAFRPDQKWSLLAHAFEYERLARTELERYFTVRDTASRSAPLYVTSQAATAFRFFRHRSRASAPRPVA